MKTKRVMLAGAAVLLAVAGATGVTAASGSPRSRNVAPHIIEQAGQLTGQVLPRGIDRPVPVASFSDGCNHNYGEPGQCVPLRAPGNKPLTCAYLKEEGWLKHPLIAHYDSAHLVKKAGSPYVC